MKTLKTWAAAAAMVTLAGAAQAALVDRGGSMIYDTTRNITWLADMNLNGRMDWNEATAWANNLIYGGFDDWRLPTLNPADTTCGNSTNPSGGFPIIHFGFNCTGGELSGLFATDLGNKAGESVLNQAGDTLDQIANLALFSNVQSGRYWSGTAFAPEPGMGWYFDAEFAYQNYDPYRFAYYAMAVRAGDVTASVPEPQTLALALLALGATVVARRRRPA